MKRYGNSITTGRNLSRPFIAGLSTFLFFILLGSIILWQRSRILEETREMEMANLLTFVENNIDQSLKNSFAAALGLALLIDNEGNINGFEDVATNLVNEHPTIDAVQMVPGGVITMVYPQEENRAVIGYNILEDPARNAEAFRAMTNKRMYFAGPLELKQGGVAIVGRFPVYIKNEFWGFTAVIIKLETLLNHSGIAELTGKKYRFQFSKIDVSTGEETYFIPPYEAPDKAYSQFANLPDGDWKFYIAPVDTREILKAIFPLAFLIFLLAVWLGWAMTNLLRRPAKLQALVDTQAGEIAHNELKFRTIFNQAAIGMARVNSITGNFMETNKCFQEMFGYTDEEIRSLNYIEITHPEDIEEDIVKMKQLRQGEVAEYSLQKRILKKSGEMIWIKLTVSPLWNEGETPTSHIAILEDIHDKKQGEINLRESYEMVMEQNKRLLNFSYIVSHNLRSHSSNIQALLNLYREAESDEERQNYINMLEKVDVALSQALFDLNEVVSIQTNLDLSLDPLRVIDYLNRTTDLLKVEILKKEAKIIKEVPQEMVVNFNAAYMESVLLNLLSNSLRYSEPTRPLEIKITGRQVKDSWMLEVKDNGIGIDLDQHGDKIFGLYKTFSGNPLARGVGLFITRNQVEAMGGEISVESTPGEGATFKVFFK